MKENQDLKVFIANRESACDECHENLGTGAWIFLAGEQGALCLSCADLDHLAFLPSGDAALTRRARKHTTLSALVLKWSRARKRYERQGILVEEAALEKAEAECLADEAARQLRRERQAERREELDIQYLEAFAKRIRELFPHCPPDEENTIAEHACVKYSGRVGRSAAGKSLDEAAVQLAVIAHLRHTRTDYDQLLATGQERSEARRRIQPQIKALLEAWRE